MSISFSLAELGWRAHFSTQLSLEELENTFPARVTEVHRDHVIVIGAEYQGPVFVPRHLAVQLSANVTTGDWVLIEAQTRR